MPEEVTINIGIGTLAAGIFKPCRGKSLPLKVTKAVSGNDILEEALKKRAAYDRSFRNDLTYKLYYPDGSEVVFLPGSQEPFTLEKYKDDLGKTYNRINLYLRTEDIEVDEVQEEVCVIKDENSDDDSLFEDFVFEGNSHTF